VIRVTINGKTESVGAGTIEQLVHDKGLRPEALVVEHNFTIVKQPQWSRIQLSEGDTLELLSFVGGG